MPIHASADIERGRGDGSQVRTIHLISLVSRMVWLVIPGEIGPFVLLPTYFAPGSDPWSATHSAASGVKFAKSTWFTCSDFSRVLRRCDRTRDI